MIEIKCVDFARDWVFQVASRKVQSLQKELNIIKRDSDPGLLANIAIRNISYI
jgi:hypothetical protein